MGVGESKISTFEKELALRYDVKEKRIHSVFGEISILVDKDSQKKYAMKENMFTSNDEFKKSVRECEKLKSSQNHPIFISLLDFIGSEDSHLCSTAFRLSTIYDFYERDLSLEVKNSKVHKQYFSEDLLFTWLSECIEGLNYLQQRGVSHESLKMSNIFLTEKSGIKLASPDVIQGISNYTQALTSFFPLRGIYLSPECMADLETKSFTFNGNPYKSDVYTLGMIFIELMNLANLDEAYDFKYSKINEKIIDEHIENAKKVYSLGFCSLIKSMITDNPSKRPDFNELNEYLINLEKSEKFSNSEPDTSVIIQKEVRNLNQVTPISQEKSMVSRKFTNTEEFRKFFNKPIEETSEFNQKETKKVTIKEEPSILGERDMNTTINKGKNAVINEFSHMDSSQAYVFNAYNNTSMLESSKFSKRSFCKTQTDKENNFSQTFTDRSQFGALDFKSINTEKNLEVHSIFYPDNSSYTGQMLNGKRHGKGLMIYDGGYSYEGEFFMDKRDGQGVLYFQNNVAGYKGQWKDDMIHGHGTMMNCNPDYSYFELNEGNVGEINNEWIKYEGNFEENKKHGYGTLFLNNGDSVSGYFYKGNLEGKATISRNMQMNNSFRQNF